MKTTRKTQLIFLVALFLICSLENSYALYFRNISVNNGLSNRRVFASAIDYKGYIWLATRVSIDRYNGEAFEHYDLSKYHDSYKIRGVVSDRSGKIFAYTEKSIYRYNEINDSFDKLSIPLLFTKNNNDCFIRTIFFDKDNTIWAGTTSGMICGSVGDKWREINEFRNNSVFAFTDGVDGDFWIGTERGISRMYRSGFKQYHAKLNIIASFANTRIQSLFYDKSNKALWIGSFADGLYSYDTSDNPPTPPRKLYNITTPIRSICKAPNDEVWVGTDGDGVFSFSQIDGMFVGKHSQANEKEGEFESNSVYHILNDNTRMWISTYSGGVMLCNYFSISRNIFRHLKENINSLFNNHVNTIIEDSNNDLWFGTNSGISKLNRKTGKWSHLFNENTTSRGGVILTLCEDNRKNMWAAGFATDLYCININTGAIQTITPTHKKTFDGKKNYIYSIIQDQQGFIWFGGNINELTKYNPLTKEFKYYNILGTNKICEYSRDTLLVATLNGLYYVNKITNEVSMVDLFKAENKETTTSSFVNGLLVDPLESGTIWMSMEGGGLYKYNIYTKNLKVYTDKEGLSSNYVYGVMHDGYDRLWISTENGLNCFNYRTNSLESFFEPDGLPDNTFNYLAYTKCKNGNMIWGTPKGAVEIVPEDIRKKNKLNINLRLTSFSLNNQKIVPGSENSPLISAIDDAKEIDLNYSQRSFSFEFLDLNYSSYAQTHYSWMLEGFDKEWSDLSKEHKAVYTNIPAGTYTFLIKAVNLGNYKQSVTRQITITVHPPFWMSPLAILFYFALIVGMGYLINKYWKNKIESKNSEEKIRFFVNMAHDVRTPITLIKAPLNEVEQENLSEDGRTALAMAQRNLDKLFNLVTQLLDFQRIESSSARLLVEETSIHNFINTVSSNFLILAKEKELEITVDLPNTDYKVWLDRKKVTLVLENLLSNAIKYSIKGGHIRIKISLNEKLMILTVSDDGIGIPIKDQKKLFELFYRAENAVNSKETGSGIGLMLTKKLITLHKGKISFTSLEKFGTTFKIEIPYLQNDYKENEIIEKQDRTDFIEQAQLGNQKPIKILLVEDNDEMRGYLCKQLQKEYSIIEAQNGEEALEIVKNDAPDFVLSDIMMPGMSGFDLCSILKKDIMTCHIPIILLSSLSDRSDIVHGLNIGADDYITKPFDLTILETKIKTIVKNRVLFKKKFIDKSAKIDEFATINSIDKEFMTKVIKFVEDNLTNENFTIDNLALEMAMSRSVFYKKLKALTNENPKDLVKEIKMRKASELLLDRKYPINEIAYLTGFPNSKYFSTAFKKYYGISPSRYIEEQGTSISVFEEDE